MIKAAIIAEGRDDQAVITHVLKAASGIQQYEINYLRPADQVDETDLGEADAQEALAGGWIRVKSDCEEGTKIEEVFGNFLADPILIIQLDSAECEDYGVSRPKKPKEAPGLKSYSSQHRLEIIKKVKEWLGDQFREEIVFAIAIEETEAWVLAHLETNVAETAKYNDPKDRLNKVWNKTLPKKDQKHLSAGPWKKFITLAKPLSKPKNLSKAMERNESLKKFVESLPQPT